MHFGALFIIVTSRSSAAQQPTVHVGDRARLTIAGRAEPVVVDLLFTPVAAVAGGVLGAVAGRLSARDGWTTATLAAR
jgi:hypothetical protein